MTTPDLTFAVPPARVTIASRLVSCYCHRPSLAPREAAAYHAALALLTQYLLGEQEYGAPDPAADALACAEAEATLATLLKEMPHV